MSLSFGITGGRYSYLLMSFHDGYEKANRDGSFWPEETAGTVLFDPVTISRRMTKRTVLVVPAVLCYFAEVIEA